MCSKKFISGLIIVTTSLASTYALSKELVDKVVAIVNTEPILHSELKKFSERVNKDGGIDPSLLTEETEASLKKDSATQLEFLIKEKLIESEVKRLRLELGDGRVNAEMNTMAKRNGISLSQLEALMKKQGYTVEEYKKNLKARLERQSFYESEIISKLRITDEDAYNEFLKNNPDYVPSLNEFTVSQIFFAHSKKSDLSAKERALAVYEKLGKQGETFESLANTYNEDKGRAKDGYLGHFKAGEFIPEIEKQIQRLAVGDVSLPIESRSGYHIIKVLDKKNARDPRFLRVKEQIKSQLVEKNFKRQLKNWFESKKQDSYIKRY